MRDVFAGPVPVTLAIVGAAGRFPVRRIYGLARNHSDHAQETGESGLEAPFFFLKPADGESLVVVGAGETGKIRYPSLTRRLFHEIELVIALGTGGKDIAASDAHRHVYGYAVGLDMTRFDLLGAAASQGRPWCTGKSFDDCAVIGPITPASMAGGIADAELHLRVNGAERQRSRVSRMIWNIDTIIAEMSRVWELRAGDLIFTGTPAGVGAVVPGDTMEGGITGLGTLKVKVQGANATTSAITSDAPVQGAITHYLCEALTKPLPVYSHATIYRGVAQISAVQGFVPGTFSFPQAEVTTESAVAAEADQMMQNLAAILLGVGSDFGKILKMTLYFTDMARDFVAVNEVINRYIPEHSPARSSIGVAALPRACKVVVDCCAAVE